MKTTYLLLLSSCPTFLSQSTKFTKYTRLRLKSTSCVFNKVLTTGVRDHKRSISTWFSSFVSAEASPLRKFPFQISSINNPSSEQHTADSLFFSWFYFWGILNKVYASISYLHVNKYSICVSLIMNS